MPPPNITGQLHLGHALFLTLQDIQTRFHQILGDETLWLPGTDHAGLATHEKIIESLKQEGCENPTSGENMKRGWKWKGHHHSIITNQKRRMGASCDWSKERFTLDEDYQATTRFAFKKMWDAGLIYKEGNDWFADMTTLARELISDIEKGEIDINPLSSQNELLQMLHNIKPWCLSRQILWGMRIPLKQYNNTYVFDEGEQTQGTPETDTLDTWFLSSLWPFATLNWPHSNDNLKKFYPSNWMETGDDILFFWCARMWMMGKFLTGSYPFKRLFLHGLIRDKHGRKMSKSLGNGISPLLLLDKIGADALRWHLAIRAEPAQDIKFSEQACLNDSKWLNKIWQAGRFLSQFGHPHKQPPNTPYALEELTQKWMQALKNDEFPSCARLIQSSFREEFCGQWIETHKNTLREGNTLVLEQGWELYLHYLRLFHPFLPFLTTELHQRLWGD